MFLKQDNKQFANNPNEALKVQCTQFSLILVLFIRA